MTQRARQGEIVVTQAMVVRAFLIVIALGVVVIVAFGDRPVKVDGPAPALAGTTLNGETFALEALRGQVVFLNFMGSWCGPCVRELPDLQAASKAFPDVRFVAVAVDSPEPDLRALMTKTGVDWPVVPAKDAALAPWRLRSVPMSAIVDRSGALRWSRAGAVTRAEAEDALRAVGAGGAAAPTP